MDQVRTPSDQTLARLDRAGRRRSRQYLNDRVLDRESVDELLSIGELPKLANIKLFLVQVWPQFGHGGQDEECDQRQKAERAVYLKNPTLSLHLASRPAHPTGKITSLKLACYPTKMWR
jgi:hypothetical protein